MNNDLEHGDPDFESPEYHPMSADNDNAASKNSRDHESGFGPKFVIFISLLALIFTAIGITVGYKHWLRIDEKAKYALKQITALQEQADKSAKASTVEALRAEFMDARKNSTQHLDEAMKEVEKIGEEVRYSAATVDDQITAITKLQAEVSSHIGKKPADQILLADVRLLLESAPRRLRLAYDKQGALDLLKTADQLLIKMGYPQLLEIRQALTRDIVNLKQFEAPDINQMIGDIDQLEAEIRPLVMLEHHTAEQITLFPEESTSSNSISGRVKQFINASVSIKKQHETPQEALSTVDKQRVDQLVQLHLTSIRLLILQQRGKAMRQQINALQSLLERYYLQSVAKPWLEILDELKMTEMQPDLPSIDTALNLLDRMLYKETTP